MPAGTLQMYRAPKVFHRKRKQSVNRKQTKQIKKNKSAIDRLDNQVLKVKDNQFQTITDISNTVQAKSITDMAPWNSSDPLVANALRMTSREGDSYLVRNFTYRGTIELSDASNIANCIARIIVVHTPDSGQPAAFTDILTSNRIHAFKKMNPPQKYSILYDRSFSMQKTDQVTIAGQATCTEKFRHEFKINLNFRKDPKKVTFGIGNTGVAPIMGSITMYVWANQPPAGQGSTTGINIRGQSRLRFLDN